MIGALLLLLAPAWAETCSDGVAPTGRNPMTGGAYTCADVERIRTLAAACPTNPLVPGTKAAGKLYDVQGALVDRSQASVLLQRIALAPGPRDPAAQGVRDAARARLLELALVDLRARTLLARQVVVEIDTGKLAFTDLPGEEHPTGAGAEARKLYRQRYFEMDYRCAEAATALRTRFEGGFDPADPASREWTLAVCEAGPQPDGPAPAWWTATDELSACTDP